MHVVYRFHDIAVSSPLSTASIVKVIYCDVSHLIDVLYTFYFQISFLYLANLSNIDHPKNYMVTMD